MTNCKICKSESIRQLDDIESISYKGSVLSISMEYSVCNECEREFVSKQQILNNDSRVRDAKKSVDEIYLENSDGYWHKRIFDENGNVTYFENSRGYWYKNKYDENSNETYFEDSFGEVVDMSNI